MKNKIMIIIFAVLICIELIAGFEIRNMTKTKIKLYNEENKKQEILSHYNKYVITNTDANIYAYNDHKYINVGKIGHNEVLELSDMEITYKDKYFKIINLDDEYYIKYDDVDKIEDLQEYSQRYKNYIPYNKNITTKELTNFYNEDDNLVYSFNKSYELPIIINNKDKYGVEFNDRLLFVKEEDIENIKDNKNTNTTYAKEIPVLNYHFFYKDWSEECHEIICENIKDFQEQLKYLKDKGYLTLKIDEFVKWMYGEIELPQKSILLTVDDGAHGTGKHNGNHLIPLLEEYDMYATLFLITGWWSINNYQSDKLDVESHTDNLHREATCGYRSKVNCIPYNELLEDLKNSIAVTKSTKAFCFPFYEYTNESIKAVKEAGFKVAFTGGNRKANRNADKYKIPRYVILSNTTIEEFKSYVN